MAPPPSILLILSLALNVALSIPWIWPSLTPSWTARASLAAETASLFDCNDHGDLYVDTLLSLPVNDTAELLCECYECFTGPHCADAVPNCDANVDSGDPLLFAPYWKQNAEASAVLIPGWYRMSYVLVEGASSAPLTLALETEIRKLHKLVGNAVVEGKYIVLGTGSMQLLNAAVASLSPTSGNPASVVSATPYYGAYRSQTEMFETAHYHWAGDANVYAEEQGLSNESTIEFVTSPNNPDALIRQAVLNGSNASTVYDLAYYWPHFTAITGARDNDVMLFTLSKVTGHAGSRVGWAIVKDAAVYKKLVQYVGTNIIGVSHESQLRATQLLRVVNKGYSYFHSDKKPSLKLSQDRYASEGLSFHYAYAKLRYRWETLSRTMEKSQRFSLQHLEPQYCTFFNEITGPSPAYAWVRCELEEDQDCTAVLSEAGITGREGSAFGASDRYVRLSLLKRDSVFENLIQHLTTLVSTGATATA